ncbi:MAG: serine dehydratase subunit alpha family protein [Lachnospiraceae bacterium]|jgi:L-cysteine desulfidase|nr:serine dehydratase subunit alpha family protein [Lachnospiraceae bacterium]
MDKRIYEEYLEILKEELVPALGCTEPIAIAYGAAKARELLGQLPEQIVVRCSGNIIKNVKAVIVPATGDMKGIETSAILGAVGGNADKKLEVLVDIRDEDLEKTRELLKKKICRVELLEGVSNLQIIIEMSAGKETALAEIAFAHTNIVRLEKNGEVVFSKEKRAESAAETDRSLLNLKDIYEFAKTVRIEDVQDLLDRQLAYNMTIAKEGLTKKYGANVGATILKYYGDDVRNRARALPAAGSDARMNGCALPVMINSGSGNQGMTVSLPVAVFADYLFADEETKYRALVLSNLAAIYQKNELGKLSAYCGAVSAATGAGAGIAYLHGGDFEVIMETMTNTLANVSGIVCDGAKASCAAKIASSVDAAIMAYYMAANHQGFKNGEGLVKKDAEATIKSFGRMGREGMRSTDVEILKIMLEP